MPKSAEKLQITIDPIHHNNRQGLIMADSAAENEGAPLAVWIGLSVTAAISFYCQAVVTEERYVDVPR